MAVVHLPHTSKLTLDAARPECHASTGPLLGVVEILVAGDLQVQAPPRCPSSGARPDPWEGRADVLGVNALRAWTSLSSGAQKPELPRVARRLHSVSQTVALVVVPLQTRGRTARTGWAPVAPRRSSELISRVVIQTRPPLAEPLGIVRSARLRGFGTRGERGLSRPEDVLSRLQLRKVSPAVPAPTIIPAPARASRGPRSTEAETPSAPPGSAFGLTPQAELVQATRP